MSDGQFTTGLPSSAPQFLYPSLESVPKPGFYDSLPGSGAEARTRADRSQGYGATGKSMGYVSIPVTILPYGDDLAFVKPPTDGQLVFSNTRGGLFGSELALISIDNLNAILKNGWKMGMDALSPTSQLYTQQQAAVLQRIHPRYWSKLDFVSERWASAATDAELGIAFLFLEGFINNYTRGGWVRGIQMQTGYELETTLRTSGSVESVENIWGDDILMGDRLWLIVKRVFDEKTQRWGHFAFIPWTGRGVDPSFADLSYIGYSGHICQGRAFFIGTVETWMEHVKINDTRLPSYLSMTTGSSVGPRERQPNCLRITYNGIAHTRMPVMLV